MVSIRAIYWFHYTAQISRQSVATSKFSFTALIFRRSIPGICTDVIVSNSESRKSHNWLFCSLVLELLTGLQELGILCELLEDHQNFNQMNQLLLQKGKVQYLYLSVTSTMMVSITGPNFEKRNWTVVFVKLETVEYTGRSATFVFAWVTPEIVFMIFS